MGGTLNVDKIVGTSGFDLEVNGQTPLSVDSSGNVTLGGGTLIGSRNKVINGRMDISQRGTSFAGLTSGNYSLDRWYLFNSTAAVATISQAADAPSTNEFQSSLRVTVTTADASIAAGDLHNIQQRIEGYNVRDLIGKTFTLSFWVRSAKTGTHCVSFVNSGVDRSYVMTYTVNTANTWEYKTILVTGGLPSSGGTWNWTNGIGLIVEFTLACGTTYQTTPGAWQAGNFGGTSAQVNCLDTVGNIFAFTGVQLEAGSVATPFEHRAYQAELDLCKRYYEKSFDTTILSLSGVWQTQISSPYILQCGTPRFQVEKRNPPSLVFLSPQNGSSGVGTEYNSGGVFVANRALGAVASGNNGFEVEISGVGTTGNNFRFHWTADSEL